MRKKKVQEICELFLRLSLQEPFKRFSVGLGLDCEEGLENIEVLIERWLNIEDDPEVLEEEIYLLENIKDENLQSEIEEDVERKKRKENGKEDEVKGEIMT